MTYAWEFGDRGERIAFDCLRADGWHLVNTAAATDGGAPMLTGYDDKLRLPDILGWRDGEPRWFEVKAKDSAILHQKTGELRHGVDRPKYRDYQRIADRTGVKVQLVVYERDKQVLLAAGLSELEVVDKTTAQQASEDYNGHAVVFFRREDFTHQTEATRFNGETYIRGEPLSKHRKPAFATRATAWGD